VQVRDAANQDPSDAASRARAAVMDAPDSVTGTGEVDTVRYGHVLRSRQLIGVRGVGASYDGVYAVRRVKHVLARGQYTQQFTLGREGRGSLLAAVRP
jgi:hypothetical protein